MIIFLEWLAGFLITFIVVVFGLMVWVAGIDDRTLTERKYAARGEHEDPLG